MLDPVKAWPRTVPEDEDIFTAFVKSGNCDAVRDFFNDVFFENRTFFLAWKYLKIALKNKDKPMMRLLITWGAAVPESVRGLTEEQAQLLRRCGARVMPANFEKEKPVSQPTAHPLSADKIPSDWREALLAFQKNGAAEAVIAGGALRDLFNDRAINDVDIFLKTRGGDRRNKKFIEKSFKKAGLNLTKPRFGGSYDGSLVFTAGPRHTEFNVTFVENFVSTPGHPDFAHALMSAFDIWLCRIAYDGKKVITTPEYMKDVLGKHITRQHTVNSGGGHLDRIVEKYPDWRRRIHL